MRRLTLKTYADPADHGKPLAFPAAKKESGSATWGSSAVTDLNKFGKDERVPRKVEYYGPPTTAPRETLSRD